jgi:outer membrane receptor protein involved in Fe transport
MSVSSFVSSRISSHRSAAVFLGGILLFSGGAACADVAGADAAPDQSAAPVTDLSKVVVHTRNRLEPLQDVPVSVSVVTGSELERLEAFDITAIAASENRDRPKRRTRAWVSWSTASTMPTTR